MTFNLTTESGATLTERWHDQTLDLESLKFSEANRECVFTVLEQKPDASAKTTGILRRKPLQRCRVTVNKVSSVKVLDAEGEVELYINEVEASQSNLRVKCVNGTLELTGEAMGASLDVEPSGTAVETEVNLATPIGDLSWRRKQPKPQP